MVPFLLIKLHDILYVHLHKVKVTLQKGIFCIVKSSASASIASKISSEKVYFTLRQEKCRMSVWVTSWFSFLFNFFSQWTQITSFLHSSLLLTCSVHQASLYSTAL
jgi:hypothetical protein